MVNVPRHPKAANCRSVFGGPMPSQRANVEIILRAAGRAPRRWAHPMKSSCVPRAATAPHNLIQVIDATMPDERWSAIEQDSEDSVGGSHASLFGEHLLQALQNFGERARADFSEPPDQSF